MTKCYCNLKKSFRHLLTRELAKYLIDNNISPKQLAEQTGIDETTLQKIYTNGSILNFQLAQVLYALNKWISISLIDKKPCRKQE